MIDIEALRSFGKHWSPPSEADSCPLTLGIPDDLKSKLADIIMEADVSLSCLVTFILEQQLNDHSTHGRGDEDGPFDPDCPCRGSDKQEECAKAGCGFCTGDSY
jgi:hypothetical protein